MGLCCLQPTRRMLSCAFGLYLACWAFVSGEYSGELCCRPVQLLVTGGWHMRVPPTRIIRGTFRGFLHPNWGNSPHLTHAHSRLVRFCLTTCELLPFKISSQTDGFLAANVCAVQPFTVGFKLTPPCGGPAGLEAQRGRLLCSEWRCCSALSTRWRVCTAAQVKGSSGSS